MSMQNPTPENQPTQPLVGLCNLAVIHPKILEDISEQMESRLGSRIGYCESQHKDEVLKGARMAVRIIEEQLAQYVLLLPNSKAEPDGQST